MDKDKVKAIRSVGGLATAVTSYLQSQAEHQTFDSMVWIGVSDLSKKASRKIALPDRLERDGIIMLPVAYTPKLKESFYEGFCNSVLWPLFLYFPSFVVYRETYYENYIRANEQMAQKVSEVYEPGDTIWIHDYHWMLLPGLLRKNFPGARIGFFLHTPFPSFELYRLLPRVWRSELLTGLLAADVVGLQTDDYVRHFKDSIHHLLPDVQREKDTYFHLDGRVTLIRSFPISIDFFRFNKASRHPEIKKNAKAIRKRVGASSLLLSVDRLDYTKGILSRLESFEIFLDKNRDLKENVSYILLMVPSRESLPSYKENKEAVESMISRINGKFGTLGWVPIQYLYQSVDFKKLVAMYVAADVAVIVPYRDGMNLVAKEYVSCKSDGVLILSETAGSAKELEWAIQVNANDCQEVAEAIFSALQMPKDEQHVRMKRMQNRVRRNDVKNWAASFLAAIDSMTTPATIEI